MSMTETNSPAEVTRWQNLLAELIFQVESWAQKRDWSTRRIEKRFEDHEYGVYTVPSLLMQKEFSRILLEPIGRNSVNSDGIVDLYLMPAYDDVARLFHVPDGWQVLWDDYGSGQLKSDTFPFTEETFAKLTEEMVRNAISPG